MARKPEAPEGINDDGEGPGRGHNAGETNSGGNLPSGDMTEAIFLSAVRRMDQFDEAIAGLNKQRSRFRKELKSRGFKMRLLDMVCSERELDRKEVKEDTVQLFKMRRWLQIPVGTQSELFPKEAETPSADAAYAAGYQAGVSGKAGKPSGDFTGSTQSWMDGWGAGQAKIAVDMFGKKDYTKDVDAKPAKAAGPSAAKEPKADNVTSLADARVDKAKDKAAAKAPEPAPAPEPVKAKDPVAETVKRVAAKGKKEKDPSPAVDPTKPKARATQDPAAVMDKVRELTAKNDAKEAAAAAAKAKPPAPSNDDLDAMIEEDEDEDDENFE